MAAGFALTLVFGLLWLRAATQETWKRTAGTATSVKIQSVHYNATDYTARVDLDYRYSVNAISYAGQWSGLWPSVESPNALDSDRIHEIEEEGYLLTVFYHPDYPSRSTLHAAPENNRMYANLAIAFFGLTFVYAAALYPRWKTVRANAPRLLPGIE